MFSEKPDVFWPRSSTTVADSPETDESTETTDAVITDAHMEVTLDIRETP